MFKRILKRIYRRVLGKYRLGSLLSREIEAGSTILDVGCGRSSALAGLEKKCLRVGLDIHAPYIHKSKLASIHDAYVLGDAEALPFRPDSFDCAIATEVLEHLSKSDAEAMLDEMQEVTKKKIILTTPNGFLPTYPGPEDNPDEKHISGWTVEELRKRGFKVRGLNGLKALWKVESGKSVCRLRSQKISGILVDLTELFVYHYPSSAFQLFLVKNSEKRNQTRRALRP